ncbi:carbonic anhydrase-related protein-like isoform X1 [Ostrea edulis]|uniref:carbonic anhydrase-related protein-like isoform X1 n=2 Tax=Ostrea edulis TaxID=37623 RepID=UPI0024AF4184|nr:carbonic anhydrase-related protein-like isoform X1 [Ostrea edulis]
MALTISLGQSQTNVDHLLHRQHSLTQRNSRMISLVRTVRVKEWPDDYMYARASEWEEKYPAAAGQSQSPINLVSNNAKFDPVLLERPLAINYFTSRETDILNDGHNVIIFPKNRGVETSIRMDPSARSVVSGGPLPSGSEYELSDIRFHWGRYSTRGSEHKVNGKAFPMEVQLVHWNATMYPNFEEAVGKEKGICIMSLFVQIGKENMGIRALFPESLAEIAYKGRQKTTNAPFNPVGLLPEPDLRDYWTYEGSLTMPPCFEGVTWILFRYPMMLSAEQIDDFRRLYMYSKDQRPSNGCEGRLLDNFRPVKPLNGRVVRASFQ